MSDTKMPNPPSTNGAYVHKATRIDSDVTLDGVLESRKEV